MALVGLHLLILVVLELLHSGVGKLLLLIAFVFLRRSRRSAYKIARCVAGFRKRELCYKIAQPNQVGRFYNMTFQNAPRWSPGTRLKCQIAAIGKKKNRQVCPHQSVAKIACDFRWRSNSPRWAYKIARCVAGFK